MGTPATGITAVPVTDQPQRFSNGLKGTLLLINTDLNNEVWVSYGQAPAGSASSANIPPLGNLAMPDTVAMWAVCDPGNTAMLSVVPGGTSFAPSAISIATQLLPLAADIAEQIAAAGIPLVANPVPVYNIITQSSVILFGTNNASWQGQANGGVTVAPSVSQAGLSSSIIYDDSSTGPNGIPRSWPGDGGPFAAGVLIPTVNFEPDYTTTVSGLNDTLIAAWLAGAPNGARIMAYHEANLAKNNLTGAQIQALDTHLIARIHAANPTLLYGRGLSTSAVNNGNDPTPYITPGMDFYGMDGYQASNASKTPASVFGTTLNAIRAVAPTAPVHIIETGTALDVPTWFNAIASYAIANGLAGVQSYFGAGGTQSQPFSASFAPALNAVAAQLAGAGTATTIAGGASLILPPLTPSPVAAYATANGISYDLVVKLTAGAASTSPWLKLRLQWYDSDSASALLVGEQIWELPMGVSTSAGTHINGTGPQKGAYLKITAINTDTVTATIQMQANSVSRIEPRHDLRWDAASSVNIPGYTLPPAGAESSNCIGAWTNVNVPASGSVSYLVGLYAGKAYVRFGSNTPAGSITVTMQPQPSSLFASTLLSEGLSSTNDFTEELILPRAPCLVTFSNSDVAAHTVSGMITTED